MIRALIYGCVLLMSRVPYPLAQFAGKILGLSVSLIPTARHRLALQSIRECFKGELSEEECRGVLKRVYIHFGRMIFEVPHIFRLSPDNISRYVTFENEETFRDVLARDKGVFLLTAHSGNWELMAAAVSMHFRRDSAVIVRPIDFAPLDDVVTRLRSRFGTEVIPKQRAIKRVMECIRAKKMVGILLDQNVGWYEGVFTPFLGRWACTNKGLALLAAKTGAPVVPVFTERRDDGRHHIVFEREIRLVAEGGKRTQVEENTILFTRAIEAHIRRHPDQWFWFHRRWKTRNYCPLNSGA